MRYHGYRRPGVDNGGKDDPIALDFFSGKMLETDV